MSIAAWLWRGATTLAAPILPLYLRARAERGKEIVERLGERRGEDAIRPPGPLFWFHAASVGETLSILPLLPVLLRGRPGLHVLVTTGTVTSATLLARRLPADIAPRVLHRFVPIDVPIWAARFLDAWRPDAGAFVESELWPNLLAAAAARGIPMALVNGRMSARSARRWAWLPGLARETLHRFSVIQAQSPGDAARLSALSGQAVTAPGNLKFAAEPLPADPAKLAHLRALTAGRPVLLAASTHPGEEAMVAAAHQALAARYPALLTVIVPRHPERGAAIAEELGTASRRAAGAEPGPQTAIHIADTLGELGLFYRLADVAVIGGSLVPHGGQNPLEAGRLGCPLLAGPHMHNFVEIMAAMEAAGGVARVAASPAALAEGVAAVLSNPDDGRSMAGAAAQVAAQQAELPERVAAALLPLLPAQDTEEGRVTVEA
ncbi:MAG TPA: 3-deoxy-D-manno-octulosonic acid transferase [Roseomonas sp.]|jgi:3-deoxy-D-manno-octulosonic-acid transferase